MTHDKPLVPPGADTSTAEDTPQPEDRPTVAAESAAAAPEATSLSLDKEPAPEPKASPGITFAGAAGTAPIHTQETEGTEAAVPLQDASTTKSSDRYDDFISNKYKGKVLIIDVDELDYKTRPEDFALITEKIDAVFPISITHPTKQQQ